MKLNKPKFWEKKGNLISFALIPLTLLVVIFVFIKKTLTRKINFKIPIICVGNIYIGGTGKSPTTLLIANELSKIGKRPAIVRKFYDNHLDEHELLKNYFKDVILERSRLKGINEAEFKGHDTVILDDGFQDYKIGKNFNIICFNENQLDGNGFVIPSGPLRESLKSLVDVDVVVINGEKNNSFEKKILNINPNLNIFYSFYKPINITRFKSKRIMALAGIGNPINFFQMLKKNGLNVEEELAFPDHYDFKEKEINNIIKKAKSNNCQILMTEKDYFRIKHFNKKELQFLKVSLEINQIEKLIDKIKNIYV